MIPPPPLDVEAPAAASPGPSTATSPTRVPDKYAGNKHLQAHVSQGELTAGGFTGPGALRSDPNVILAGAKFRTDAGAPHGRNIYVNPEVFAMITQAAQELDEFQTAVEQQQQQREGGTVQEGEEGEDAVSPTSTISPGGKRPSRPSTSKGAHESGITFTGNVHGARGPHKPPKVKKWGAFSLLANLRPRGKPLPGTPSVDLPHDGEPGSPMSRHGAVALGLHNPSGGQAPPPWADMMPDQAGDSQEQEEAGSAPQPRRKRMGWQAALKGSPRLAAPGASAATSTQGPDTPGSTDQQQLLLQEGEQEGQGSGPQAGSSPAGPRSPGRARRPGPGSGASQDGTAVELDPTLQVKEGTSQVTHRPLYEEEEGLTEEQLSARRLQQKQEEEEAQMARNQVLVAQLEEMQRHKKLARFKTSVSGSGSEEGEEKQGGSGGSSSYRSPRSRQYRSPRGAQGQQQAGDDPASAMARRRELLNLDEDEDEEEEEEEEEEDGEATSSDAEPEGISGPCTSLPGPPALADSKIESGASSSSRQPGALHSYLPGAQQQARLREALARVDASRGGGGGGLSHRGPPVRRRSTDDVGGVQGRFDRPLLQRRPSEGGNAASSRFSGDGVRGSPRALPASLAEFKRVWRPAGAPATTQVAPPVWMPRDPSPEPMRVSQPTLEQPEWRFGGGTVPSLPLAHMPHSTPGAASAQPTSRPKTAASTWKITGVHDSYLDPYSYLRNQPPSASGSDAQQRSGSRTDRHNLEQQQDRWKPAGPGATAFNPKHEYTPPSPETTRRRQEEDNPMFGPWRQVGPLKQEEHTQAAPPAYWGPYESAPANPFSRPDTGAPPGPATLKLPKHKPPPPSSRRQAQLEEEVEEVVIRRQGGGPGDPGVAAHIVTYRRAYDRAIVGRALRLLWDHLSGQPFSAVLDVPIPAPGSLPSALLPPQGQPHNGLQVLGLLGGAAPPGPPAPLLASVASDAHLTPQASQSLRSTLPQYRKPPPGVTEKTRVTRRAVARPMVVVPRPDHPALVRALAAHAQRAVEGRRAHTFKRLHRPQQVSRERAHWLATRHERQAAAAQAESHAQASALAAAIRFARSKALAMAQALGLVLPTAAEQPSSWSSYMTEDPSGGITTELSCPQPQPSQPAAQGGKNGEAAQGPQPGVEQVHGAGGQEVPHHPQDKDEPGEGHPVPPDPAASAQLYTLAAPPEGDPEGTSGGPVVALDLPFSHLQAQLAAAVDELAHRASQGQDLHLGRSSMGASSPTTPDWAPTPSAGPGHSPEPPHLPTAAGDPAGQALEQQQVVPSEDLPSTEAAGADGMEGELQNGTQEQVSPFPGVTDMQMANSPGQQQQQQQQHRGAGGIALPFSSPLPDLPASPARHAGSPRLPTPMMTAARAAARAELRTAAAQWQAAQQQHRAPAQQATIHMAASLDELMAGAGSQVMGLTAQASQVASHLFPAPHSSTTGVEPIKGVTSSHSAGLEMPSALAASASAGSSQQGAQHSQPPEDLPLSTSVRGILHVTTGPVRLPHVVLTQESYTGVAPALLPPEQLSPRSAHSSTTLDTGDPLVASTHTWMSVGPLPESLHPLPQPEHSLEHSGSDTATAAPDTPGRTRPANSHVQQQQASALGVLPASKSWVSQGASSAGLSGGASAALSSVTLLMRSHGVPRHHLPAALSALLQGTAQPAASAVALAAASPQGLGATHGNEEEPVPEIPRGLFGRLQLRQSMFDPLNAISSSYLANAQARKKAKQAAAAKAALAESQAREQHSSTAAGHLSQSDSDMRAGRSFARQTTLMSAAQPSTLGQDSFTSGSLPSEALSPRRSLDELEAGDNTRRQAMIRRPALKQAASQSRGQADLSASSKSGGSVPSLALPLGPTRSLPLLPSIISSTQQARAAGPHQTTGGGLMSGHSVPSLPLLLQHKQQAHQDQDQDALGTAPGGCHAPLVMPHHLNPLPFATPRQRADLESRLTSGDLLPKMAAALHSIDSLALFPRPWAHQGDPSLAEMWAQLQGRAAKQQNSGRGPLSGDSTSWDLAASPVNLHPQAAQPAHSILSQPSGPHAHHALHVTLPLEAPTGSTTTMSPRQQQQQQQAVSPRNKGASLKYGSGGGGAAAAAAGGSPDEGVQRQRRQGRLSMTGGGAGGGRRQSIAGDLPGAGVSARKRLASQEVAKTRLGKRSTVLRGGQHGAVRRSLAGNEGAAGGRGGGSPDTGHPPSLLGGRSSWMSAVNQVVGLGVMLEEEDEEGAGYDPRDLKLLDAWKVAHHTKPTGAWYHSSHQPTDMGQLQREATFSTMGTYLVSLLPGSPGSIYKEKSALLSQVQRMMAGVDKEEDLPAYLRPRAASRLGQAASPPLPPPPPPAQKDSALGLGSEMSDAGTGEHLGGQHVPHGGRMSPAKQQHSRPSAAASPSPVQLRQAHSSKAGSSPAPAPLAEGPPPVPRMPALGVGSMRARWL